MKKRVAKLLLLLAVFSLSCFAGAMPAQNAPRLVEEKTPDPAIYTHHPPPARPTKPAACTITAESLNIRTAPEGLEESRVLAWLYAGEVVTVTETRGAWLFVRAGSVEGWINSKFCKGK